MILLFMSIIAFANNTKIGSFEESKIGSYTTNTNESRVLLVVVAFALGFYNGYMDTKTDYRNGEVLTLNIIHDQKDFSSFDN